MLKLLKFLIILSFSTSAYAHKLNFSYGYYSYTAKTTSGSSKISSPSSYAFRYSHEVLRRTEVAVGYTLNTENMAGGDVSYGMDIGAFYYPFSEAETKTFQGQRVTAESLSVWRPKAGLFFHQRQFQSVRTNYAGFGITVGTEWHWKDKFFIEPAIRRISLNGPSTAEADVTEVLVGLNFDL
jgi:hypothetical protein